jgi:hypothetical protein
VLSAQGAHTAAGDYREAILVTAVAVAAALPLYYYRHRLMMWFHGRAPARGDGGLDREKPGS